MSRMRKAKDKNEQYFFFSQTSTKKSRMIMKIAVNLHLF
jgi:hypothetical protein